MTAAPEQDHPPSVADALADSIAQLTVTKAIRPPNQPIPGFRLPHADLLDAFIERLVRASAAILVYEATSIRDALPLPDLVQTEPAPEHLAIYEQIAETRTALQRLVDKAVVAGYRPAASLPVPRTEVGDELQRLTERIDALAAELNRARRPGFGGVAINLGPLSVDVDAMTALLGRMRRQQQQGRDLVDAAQIWTIAEALSRRSQALYVRLETAGIETAEALYELADRLAVLVAAVAAAARAILQKALAYAAGRAADRRSSGRRRPAQRVPRFDLAIDLGASSTRIYLRGAGLVFDQPSVVALRSTPRGKVLHAVGTEAAQMIGREPAGVETVKFLVRGAPVDEVSAQRALRHFLQQSGFRNGLGRAKALVTVETRSPEAHRRAVRSITSLAGLPKAAMIERARAAALGARLPIHGADAQVVVDVGGGSTDMAVFLEGRVMAARTTSAGGMAIDEAIREGLLRHYNLLIGPSTAERIKKILDEKKDGNIDVVGIDKMTSTPNRFSLQKEAVRSLVFDPLHNIVDNITSLIDEIHDEQRNKLQSLTVTGGGSLAPDLLPLISEMTGLRVDQASAPLTDTILGCGRLLDEAGHELVWTERSPGLD